MKSKLLETFLIAVSAVVVAWVEWEIAYSFPDVWRIILSIITGVAAGAIIAGIRVKVRSK